MTQQVYAAFWTHYGANNIMFYNLQLSLASRHKLVRSASRGGKLIDTSSVVAQPSAALVVYFIKWNDSSHRRLSTACQSKCTMFRIETGLITVRQQNSLNGGERRNDNLTREIKWTYADRRSVWNRPTAVWCIHRVEDGSAFYKYSMGLLNPAVWIQTFLNMHWSLDDWNGDL